MRESNDYVVTLENGEKLFVEKQEERTTSHLVAYSELMKSQSGEVEE